MWMFILSQSTCILHSTLFILWSLRIQKHQFECLGFDMVRNEPNIYKIPHTVQIM